MTDLTADTPLVDRTVPSPNHNARRDGPLDMLVLHYTGMATGEAALARLCDPAAEVSSHYVVEEDGTILQLVPESERACMPDAGPGTAGTDLNSASIGIEIVNGGHPYGLPPYPPARSQPSSGSVPDILARRAIRRSGARHSDIAPDRKEDTGELFPWHVLAARGIGSWGMPSRYGRICRIRSRRAWSGDRRLAQRPRCASVTVWNPVNVYDERLVWSSRPFSATTGPRGSTDAPIFPLVKTLRLFSPPMRAH